MGDSPTDRADGAEDEVIGMLHCLHLSKNRYQAPTVNTRTRFSEENSRIKIIQ